MLAMDTEPRQFSTADGSLVGAVDGANIAYSCVPNPRTLFYIVPGVRGSLLFRNGILVDEYGDYAAGPGRFAMSFPVGADIVTALLFSQPSPTKWRLTDATLAATTSTMLLLIVPQTDPAHPAEIDFLLFRNGVRLTETADYLVNGPWIQLVPQQAIQLDDTVMAVTDVGGIAVSTADGTIIVIGNSDFPGGFNQGDFNQGGFNSGGFNTGFLPNTFQLPFAPGQILLWLNGLLLTPGIDYVLEQDMVILSTLFDVNTDILTAQLYGSEIFVPSDVVVVDTTGAFLGGFNQSGFNESGFNGGGFPPVPPPPTPIEIVLPPFGPVIVTTADGSLYLSVADAIWFFRNGLLMTPDFDGSAYENTIHMGQIPVPGDIITAEVWVRHPLIPDEPDLNLGTQYTSADGSLSGPMDGANNVFLLNVPPVASAGVPTPSLVAGLLFFWNGIFLTPTIDYTISSNVITMMGGNYPNAGDILTARVFAQ